MSLDGAMNDIAEAVRKELDAAGQEIAAGVRADLSANHPPSSKEGEHPHKRTGELAGSISAEAKIDGTDRVTLTLTAAAEHAQHLENMGRPVLSHVPEKYGPRLRDRFAGTAG